MTVLIKIVTPSQQSKTENEVTRWTVRGEWNASVWMELQAKLQKVFQTRNTQFYISWFDGEDYCTIRDVSDLQEAVEFMQSQESGTKGYRIYASPYKKEHHTIFGTKPEDDLDDVKGTVETGQTETESATQQEADPIPLSQWELLNLDSEESEINKKADSELKEKEEEEEEPKPSVPVPVLVEAAPAAVVPAAAAAAVVAAESTEVINKPVATEAIPASVNATLNPATLNMAAGQPNPYMAGIPPQLLAQYYPVAGAPGIPTLYPPQWVGAPMTPTAYSAMELNAPQAGIPNAPSAPPMCPPPTVPNDPPVVPAPVAVPPSVTPVPPTKEENGSAPLPTSKKEGHKKDKCLRGPAVMMCMQTLRSMGYSLDEKQLKRLIRKHNGNLNAILDDPSLTMGN